MNMIAKLTRAQLEAFAFAGLLALLSVTSSQFNVAAGVDRALSAMAPNQVTTSAPEARQGAEPRRVTTTKCMPTTTGVTCN
jgi:hypothetical protein